ncbi:response regulator [Trichocoleus sp. FACHB-90]|uniref:response regulator transcription factor n=1 Tax=Cyanophyceae TaxID=3028117 RepID=UPI001686F376|nr:MULTISPECIES: response regulator [unclassified Trichocoleus]MBD1925419.1 response regulator [Trichocoleus sp. FACHB-90]MBD1934680.1 response regulator [Trichocoleus sp. FACHB-69]
MVSSQAQAKRILLVDDLEDNVSLLEAILAEEGYEIDSARNGKSALAKIEASPPDLILMDAMMPGMDGYEVTRRVRENTKLPFIPILMITASENASIPQGLELGANDFIRKPIDFEELMARIKASLRLKTIVNPAQ